MIRTINIDPALFGNPYIYEDDLTYEQDKLVPIRTYLRSTTLEEGKNIVDTFVQFNVLLIKHGLIDKSFNLGANFALTSRGDIVLADIGELFFDRDRIRKQIQDRVWAKWYVLNKLSPELNAYFVVEMDKHILPLIEK